MAENKPKISPGIEYKRSVSRALCSAVREPTLESLEVSANKVGLHVVQVWKAPRGEGFKAVAARFIVDAEDVLIVAFRATFGNDEWLEYPQRYWKTRFIAHDGCPEGSELRVFGVWSLTLDEVGGWWFARRSGQARISLSSSLVFRVQFLLVRCRVRIPLNCLPMLEIRKFRTAVASVCNVIHTL